MSQEGSEVAARTDVEPRVDEDRRLSEALQSRDHLEILLEAAGDAVISADREGIVRRWNGAAKDMFGRAATEMVGKNLEELWPPEQAAEARELFRRALEGESIRSRRGQRLHRDGSAVAVWLTLTPVRGADGKVLGVTGIVRDVSDVTRLESRFHDLHSRAEAEQKDLRARLVQSEKLSVMGELLGGVAHELNNPLTGVIGYAQLLLNQPCEEKMRRNLDRIQEEARRCHRIVQNLLGFSRQRRAEKQKVALHQVLEETLDLRAYPMRVDNIWVVKEFSPDLPAIVGDPHQLQQVFMNLITNAHQSMATTGLGGVLTVSTRFVAERVEVRFTDNGPGIPEAIRQRIFEPFFTTKGVGQGTGLGLAICKGILAEHGGRLTATSRPGTETCFLVELPRAASEADREPEGDALEDAAGEPPPEVGERPRRILLVDDEESIREFLGEALRLRGHQVDAVANGLLALDRLREASYDVVITDLKMPAMNGRQLWEALRRGYPEIAGRVIFTTGDLVARDTMAFLRSTGAAYLEKPFSIRSVAEALANLDPQ